MPQGTSFPVIVVPHVWPLFIAVHDGKESLELHPKYGDYYNHAEELKNKQ